MDISPRFNPRNPSTAVALAALLCASAGVLSASQYEDLKRTEPVPSTQPIPIVDFVRPPLFDQVQLSHNGSYIGAIVPGDDDHTSLITYDIVGQKLDGVSAPQGDKDIASFTWLDGNRLTYVISEKKIVGRFLFSTEADKLATANTISVEGPAGSVRVLGNLPEDRTQILVDLTGGELRYDHIEIISGSNGGNVIERYPELKTDHGFNLSFWGDKVGKLEFGVTQEDGILTLSRLQGETWLKCPIDLEEITPIDSGDEAGQILALGRRDGSAPRPLEIIDAATGLPGDIIIQDKAYDFNGWLFRDPVSHDVVGAVYDRAGPHVVWFTEAYRNLQKVVDKIFPGQVVRILGMDDSGKVLLISNGSDRQPVSYNWVNLATHKSGLIKNSAPWIDPKRMRPMGVFKYTTAEGRQLDAYITLPAGATAKNPPPMVVIPHSYSSGRSVWGFDSEAQYFASRGYAVLQPNYRGSAGYTWMYPEQESWDFRKMNDDIAAAVREAVKRGYADSNRVAIFGYDFGGYLATAGAAFEPGVYKAAIAVSGFAYDWGRYIKEDKYLQYVNPQYSRYLYKLGDPSKGMEHFDAMSPLPHASDIHSALLLAWGEYDNAELISEAKDLASAVERNGQHVETISFLDEAEGVRHLGHKIELYQKIEDFLAKNL